MLIPICDELKSICREIIEADKSLEEWAEIESDDLFQTNSFEGGFDATSNEFIFSYYGDREYWFQLSLVQVRNIQNGNEEKIIGSIAEY